MSDDFQDRLESAIQRGNRRKAAQDSAQKAQQLSVEEARRLHTSYRLALSERISHQLDTLVNHFPGFRKETLFGEAGWGAACFRDDLALSGGRRSSRYSRLEITVRPQNEYNVLDLRAKGTIANKEVFNRNVFEPIDQADQAAFEQLIDTWVIEYAELYSAQ
jgi:hypothetical protein